MQLSIILTTTLFVCSVVCAVMFLVLLHKSLWRHWTASMIHQTESNLADLLIFMPAQRLWYGFLMTAVLVGCLVFYWSNIWLVILVEAFLVIGLPGTHKWLKQRRNKRIAQQLPEALQQLSNIIQAGLSLPAAIAQLAPRVEQPLAAEFQLLVRRQKLGDSMAHALADFAQRVPIVAVQQLTLVMTLGMAHGAAQADILKRLAQAQQQHLYASERILSLSAQGRMQGRVMALLPVLLFVLLNYVEPANTQLLLQTDAGQLLLLISLVLLILGHLLVRRILAGPNYD